MVLRNDNAGLVRLSVPGKEKAIETLERINDPGVTTSWVLSSNPRRRRPKSDSEPESGSDESNRQRTRKSAKVTQKVAGWVTLWNSSGGQRINAFSILSDRTTSDNGLFCLWAIRRATEDEVKVVSRLHLSQFIEQDFDKA